MAEDNDQLTSTSKIQKIAGGDFYPAEVESAKRVLDEIFASAEARKVEKVRFTIYEVTRGTD